MFNKLPLTSEEYLEISKLFTDRLPKIEEVIDEQLETNKDNVKDTVLSIIECAKFKAVIETTYADIKAKEIAAAEVEEVEEGAED